MAGLTGEESFDSEGGRGALVSYMYIYKRLHLGVILPFSSSGDLT